MSLIRCQRGFTLLEMMVVCAIAAILVAVALPSLATLGLSAARSRGGPALLAAFSQARSEAIARNTNVYVCRRNYLAAVSAGGYPTCDLSSGGSWAQGWIVFQNTSGTFGTTMPATATAATDIISVSEPIGQIYSVATNNTFKVVPTTNPAYVTFASNGRTSTSLTFTICDTLHKLSDAREISIGLSGYINLSVVNSTTATTVCA